MTERFSILINGETRDVPAGATLAHVLASVQVDPEQARGVAVAVNDEVVRRQLWADTPVSDGDRIEIVTARQGG